MCNTFLWKQRGIWSNPHWKLSCRIITIWRLRMSLTLNYSVIYARRVVRTVSGGTSSYVIAHCFIISVGCLWQGKVRFARGYFFIVDAKRQIWLTMKSTWLLKPFLFPSILRFWQGEEINRRQGILEGISTLCIESNIIRRPCSYASNQRTNEFTYPACVFIQLSLNKKFEATLTHDIHCSSVFTNQGIQIKENIDTNRFKNWLKYLLVCNWRYLSLESVTLSKFSQFNPWVDNHVTCMFKGL